MQLLSLMILALAVAPARDIRIHTRNSLSLRHGVYSSVLFVAETCPCA